MELWKFKQTSSKKVVDQITTNYLTKHHPEEMQVFQKAWEHEGNLQQEAYGKKQNLIFTLT